MCLYVKFNLDANCFLSAQSKDCMNSASYKYRNMSARRGAQFVLMRMQIISREDYDNAVVKKFENLSYVLFSVLALQIRDFIHKKSPSRAKAKYFYLRFPFFCE